MLVFALERLHNEKSVLSRSYLDMITALINGNKLVIFNITCVILIILAKSVSTIVRSIS